MITRIVRMQFAEGNVEEFLSVFRANMQQIRDFHGMQRLELHRDASASTIFYTISIWEDAQALEAYRNSDLFREVWTKTKSLFAGPPQAFSLIQELCIV